jgi:hypothetical protein
MTKSKILFSLVKRRGGVFIHSEHWIMSPL